MSPIVRCISSVSVSVYVDVELILLRPAFLCLDVCVCLFLFIPLPDHMQCLFVYVSDLLASAIAIRDWSPSTAFIFNTLPRLLALRPAARNHPASIMGANKVKRLAPYTKIHHPQRLSPQSGTGHRGSSAPAAVCPHRRPPGT